MIHEQLQANAGAPAQCPHNVPPSAYS